MPAKEIIVVDAGTVEKTLEAFENWKLETGNLKKCRGAVFRKFNIQIFCQQSARSGAARNRAKRVARGGECASGDQ